MPKAKTYAELQTELDELMTWFDATDSFDVDVAVKKYERGRELIKLLEAQLSQAENKIAAIKATFGDA